jgi:hypothetical protein
MRVFNRRCNVAARCACAKIAPTVARSSNVDPYDLPTAPFKDISNLQKRQIDEYSKLSWHCRASVPRPIGPRIILGAIIPSPPGALGRVGLRNGRRNSRHPLVVCESERRARTDFDRAACSLLSTIYGTPSGELLILRAHGRGETCEDVYPAYSTLRRFTSPARDISLCVAGKVAG